MLQGENLLEPLVQAPDHEAVSSGEVDGQCHIGEEIIRLKAYPWLSCNGVGRGVDGLRCEGCVTAGDVCFHYCFVVYQAGQLRRLILKLF